MTKPNTSGTIEMPASLRSESFRLRPGMLFALPLESVFTFAGIRTLVERSRDSEQGWLDLQEIATVEVTSEDSGFPIEAALNFESGPGWRAAEAGEQQVRTIFDHPTPIRRIQLHFVETTVERTQEFTLRWSSVSGGPMKEIVRQQWNFSPTGSTHEVEDCHVALEEVSVLELAIKPDLSCEKAAAGLAMWRVA